MSKVLSGDAKKKWTLKNLVRFNATRFCPFFNAVESFR